MHDSCFIKSRWFLMLLAVWMFCRPSGLLASMGVETYGGSPGLVIGGEPAPALFAAISPAPGSYLFDGKLHLSAYRNRTATVESKAQFPDAYTLEAEWGMREALTPDGNLALRFHVQEGGQQAYLLILRHRPGGNQVVLSRSGQGQGQGTQRLLERAYPWSVGEAVRVRLVVDGGVMHLWVNGEDLGSISDPAPLPGGKVRLTAYSAAGWIEQLRLTDRAGSVLLHDEFDDIGSSENWTNWKQLLRVRDGHAPSFAQIGLHRYQDTNTKGGAGSLAEGGAWSAPGKYNWSAVDRFLKGIAERDADSLVLGRINVNAPRWWLEAHPDQRMVRVDPETGKHLSGLYASYSSQKWREDVTEGLRAYLRYLKEHPEGKRIGGLIIGAGGAAEWMHSWGIQFHDYSPAQLAAFRQWLEERYGHSVEQLQASWGDEKVSFESAQIPLPARRLAGDVGEFFDPAVSNQVPDYLSFHSQVVADAILHFAQVIKEESPHILTAVYYGYQFPQTAPDHDKGHSALRRVLASPFIDAINIPSGYLTRHPGGANAVGLSLETVRLHGKLWLQDDDSRTHLAGNHHDELTRYYGRAISAWESVQMLRRNFAFSLSKAAGQFHLDFGLGWLDDPQIMAAIADHHRIAQEALSKDRRPNAQIVVVTSPETGDYLRGGFGMGRTLYKNQYREHLWRIGAPVDVIHIDDLEKARDYRLYIFLDTFYLNDQQRSAIDRVVKRDGKTALWFYAPGYVTPTGLSEQAMARTTDIDLAIFRKSALTRLYFSDMQHPITQGLAPGSLYEMLDEVGPLVYSRDAGARVLGMQNATVRYFEPAWRNRPETVSGFVVKDLGAWRSIWCAVPNLPPAVLRNIARWAGVHIYGDGDDVIYANRFMLSLHTRYAGSRQIHLPRPLRVVDAITGKVVADGADAFAVDLQQNETRLWWLEE